MANASNLKLWSQNQQKLRLYLDQEEPQAVQLALSQHAMMHAAEVSHSGLWSFSDEVLHDVTEGGLRRIPAGSEHSIAWCIYHLARCEDVTMNVLVAGRDQVINQGQWQKRLNSPICHTGNEMSSQEMVDFSRTIDVAALLEYRNAVGQATQEIISQLKPLDFKCKMAKERVRRVRQEGAIIAQSEYILNYWSRRTIAGLLLMPPTRHCLVHLNESQKLKKIPT